MTDDPEQPMKPNNLHARLAASKIADRANIEQALADGTDSMELNRRCGFFTADKLRLREARVSGHGPALKRGKRTA